MKYIVISYPAGKEPFEMRYETLREAYEVHEQSRYNNIKSRIYHIETGTFINPDDLFSYFEKKIAERTIAISDIKTEITLGLYFYKDYHSGEYRAGIERGVDIVFNHLWQLDDIPSKPETPRFSFARKAMDIVKRYSEALDELAKSEKRQLLEHDGKTSTGGR